MRRHLITAALLLALALLFIVLGLAQGDALDTLRKAALICFECIGIG
ncbi:MAG: hypothetical protein LBL27_01565 [Coriobacteriales bacterium]|nr:hypothetical protein [Coriobacteriales bacterium]